MNINFPAIDENFIKTMVEQGYYSNATEVVRAAVRQLREQEEKQKRLLAAIQLGEDDIAAGRTVPYTEDFWDRLMEKAIKHAAEGGKYDPDVIG